MQKLRCGHLFNGIGGFQIAAHWMGWENVFHCEIDRFCNSVVKKYFQKSVCYEDIKKTDFTPWSGSIDLLTGGFPCQPYSQVGKRKGDADNRHLWPEMLRAIREVRPRYALGENVSGFVNWNGGVVFDQVQADMEAEGYETVPFLLPACGLDAVHKRYRIWIVAYSGEQRREGKGECAESIAKGWAVGGFQKGNASDAECVVRSEGGVHQVGLSGEEGADTGPSFTLADRRPGWDDFPTQSPLCGRDDGIPDRMDRIKSLGNAVVPQVVLEIYKVIDKIFLL